MHQVWKACAALFVIYTGILAQTENQVVFPLGAFQNVSLSDNATVEAAVSRIPAEATYLTLQFHTQHHNTTLSFTKVPEPGSSHTAVDAGLLSPLLARQTTLTWYLLSPDGEPVTGTGVILPYTGSDPVPGGCGSDTGENFDPRVHLHYNLFETTIGVAPANVGYARAGTPPDCNLTTGPGANLQYDIYRYLLPQGDLSEESFLRHVQNMASVTSVWTHGTKVMTWISSDELSTSFSSIPGQGVVYCVVVRDPTSNASSAYVPAHSYACSFSAVLDGCVTQGKVSTKVFFTCAASAGLFICFFGHQFFKCELFCMGHAFAALIFFVAITKTTTLDYDLRLALTAVMGVVGGVVLVMSWWRLGLVLCSMMAVGLMLGFLLASAVFFTPVGDFSIFQSSAVFWPTFCGITLCVPLIFVRWPREGSIVACGVLGSYSVVLAVGTFVSTSLSYGTLDVLKRLLNTSYSRVFTDVALRGVDYILLTAWVLLAVSGVVLQLRRERERPFFPPSPYLMWKQERERRKTNVLDPSHHVPPLPSRLEDCLMGLVRRKEPTGERTPLLL